MSSCCRPSFQVGVAKIVATAIAEKSTQLTKISHRAPTRILPIRSSLVAKKGAALCALSNYGGGMLQGDASHVNIRVEPHANLGITTQGANRIYKSRENHQEQHVPSETIVNATVESQGLLVMAPDPCVLFSSARYQQSVNLNVQDDGNVVWIDWFSAGRVAQGEVWDFSTLSTRTSLNIITDNDNDNDNSSCILLESLDLNRSTPRPEFDCFASVILRGPQLSPIINRFRTISVDYTSKKTSIRKRRETNDDVTTMENIIHLGTNDNHVVVSHSVVDSRTAVVRILAQTNEDIYRILQYGLEPLDASHLGTSLYRDRIQSSASAPPARRHYFDHLPSLPRQTQSTDDSLSSLWPCFVLVDSALPTGSFAHSSSLEAAAQLGLVRDERDVKSFASTVTLSLLQMLVPFVRDGFRAMEGESLQQSDVSSIFQVWKFLDAELDKRLVSNKIAREASLDQGSGLLRVVSSTTTTTSSQEQQHYIDLVKLIQKHISTNPNAGHLGPLFGIMARVLGVDNEEKAFYVLGYTVMRDVLSAAVRLNIIGPLSSVAILKDADSVVSQGIELGEALSVETAGGCAPVVDAIQPCHEDLAVRLFRS